MKATKPLKLKLKSDLLLFTLIGISSHENDYRLAWSLNTTLDLNFAKTDSIEGGFSCYLHDDECLPCRLISNRCEDGYLLNKYKNLDFFIKFEQKLTEGKTAEWIGRLRKTPLVGAVTEITVGKEELRVLEV